MSGEEIPPDPEREASIFRPYTRQAVFTLGDGSPSYSFEQETDESDEDFFIRVKTETENSAGYVSCAGIYVTTKDNAMYAKWLHEQGVPLDNLKALDEGDKLKKIAHQAIRAEYGDRPDIDHIIDVIAESISPRIIGTVLSGERI